MRLVQILLPLFNNEFEVFPKDHYIEIREELTEKFGGITTYSRTPATGLWKENENKTVKDDIIIYEVMAENLDRVWWEKFKEELEKKFKQDTIIIRSWEIEVM
ncbi:hypothetical protein [Adhaeribacter aquaticus]|uniref:hypothetical protein n=1 Tax=Adhaeribacter aquaticus TaxID=299567 RepID=UPI00047B5BAA|nr:hypothetical protein [Adhaeribacter aquaticus]